MDEVNTYFMNENINHAPDQSNYGFIQKKVDALFYCIDLHCAQHELIYNAVAELYLTYTKDKVTRNMLWSCIFNKGIRKSAVELYLDESKCDKMYAREMFSKLSTDELNALNHKNDDNINKFNVVVALMVEMCYAFMCFDKADLVKIMLNAKLDKFTRFLLTILGSDQKDIGCYALQGKLREVIGTYDSGVLTNYEVICQHLNVIIDDPDKSIVYKGFRFRHEILYRMLNKKNMGVLFKVEFSELGC